ncbi:MAG: helix-turn-helix domain-containing protein [Lutibacter sp.]|nr:helix-turn-helix domain-containing protein [Lutibacter sp.]
MKDLTSVDTAFTRELNKIIFANLANEHFGVNELAREIGMSRFSLNRKLHFIYHKTINQYIRESRLQRAMEMLQQESVTASEVAFKVGFSSPAYFSTCFSEYYGFPPGEAKKRDLFDLVENHKDLTINPISTKKGSKKKIKNLFKWNKGRRRSVFIISLLIWSLVGLIYFFNSIKNTPIENKKKSIAVLPFINDSKDSENVYFINGVMEAILDNLSKIEDLEVRPRTSVELYRNNSTKTIPQIARELGVNYIIEGSGQKIGDQVRLTIQLIDAKSDNHLFSHQYSLTLKDIFNLQSEVAIKVADEIEAVITVGEKELIKKPPTTSVAAWEMYSRGLELHNIADIDNNIENNRQAIKYFERAIQLDSTYTEPYVQLGWIYNSFNQPDSAFIHANKALHFNDKNSDAYVLKGWLLAGNGLDKKAEEAFNLAILYNPNYAPAYALLGDMYYDRGDSYKTIKNKLKAIKLESNSIDKRKNLISLWDSFNNVGLYEEGQKYAEKLIALTGDSTYYYWSLLQSDYNLGKYKSVVNYAHKIYRVDSLNLGKLLGFHHSYFLGNTYVNLRDYKEAYRVLGKYATSMKLQGRKIEPYHYIGYIYLQNGRIEEAKFHFEGSIQDRLWWINQKKPKEVSPPNLGLAFIYAAIGNKAKALEHLRVVNRCASFLYTCAQITGFKISPMVDCIRNEPEYQEFLKNAETRYLEEHNKVEKLLRREGLLISSNK